MAQCIDKQTFVGWRKAPLLAATAACCLLASLPLSAQDLSFMAPAPEEQLIELEPVVVYGGAATPQMWKVSKGDHVLWILADTTAPAGSQWRFDEVEARLADSRFVLYPGKVDVDIGFFRVIGLVAMTPSAYKALTKNPDNKTLKDVLPPELYERWRALKTEYAPRDDDLERQRPSGAMAKLEEMIGASFRQQIQSVQTERPAPRPWLRPLVDKAAKKHKVRIRTAPDVENKVRIRNVRGILGLIRAFDQVDVNCVTQKLEYLERMAEYLKQRAAGDAQADAPTRVPDCDEVDLLISKLRSGEVPDTVGFLETMDNARRQTALSNQRLDAQWVATVEAALAKNESIFAVLPLYQLARPNGHLARLRELGYEVEGP